MKLFGRFGRFGVVGLELRYDVDFVGVVVLYQFEGRLGGYGRWHVYMRCTRLSTSLVT